MDATDAQIGAQTDAQTDSTTDTVHHIQNPSGTASAFSLSASTGSTLLDSFVIHVVNEGTTTLLGDGPVVGESLTTESRPAEYKPSESKTSVNQYSVGQSSVDQLPAASKRALKQTIDKEQDNTKTARELAVERMERILRSDRTSLRHGDYRYRGYDCASSDSMRP